ncbi:MAG: DUF6702 family protein [Pseudomonadota bacterium]
MSMSTAYGHEQALALTEVTFLSDGETADCVQSGCRIEVAHRLAVHDAESTLMNVLGARADLIGDRDAQVRFEAYVAEHFALIDPESGDQLGLTLLGGEVERGYYWVYQEGKLNSGQDKLLVSQDVLMDAIPTQTNRVNLKYRGKVSTLIFGSASELISYTLE